MKIVVLVKQVPDTWGERVLEVPGGRLDRGASDAVIDEIGERAVEAALVVKDSAKDTEVVVITMGPAGANDVLRKSLAMGADSAVHVIDDSLAGADLSWTATVLAAAVKRTGFDVLVAGNESTDGRGGVVPSMIAELLGVPQVTFLNSVEIAEGKVTGERRNEHGSVMVSASTPVVVSVTESSNEPRFPNFKGIMSAKKKPLETITVADLGIDFSGLGTSVVVTTAAKPAREAGKKIVDEGNAAEELAEFLSAGRLI